MFNVYKYVDCNLPKDIFSNGYSLDISKNLCYILLSQDKDRAPPKRAKKEDPHELKTTEAPQSSSALFFQYNTQLGPVRMKS